MGQKDGFLRYDRELPATETVATRVQHSGEFYLEYDKSLPLQQAARCMDCGVPFCHNGCPLGNKIPDFNDAVYRNDWAEAYDLLSETNNFPEFTGRICPAPCEASCVLGINQPAVAIEFIEKSIAEEAFETGLVKARRVKKRTGKKVAVVGSGPAGLAAAEQLNLAGHSVTIFEKDDRAGGLLRYGIPDFKLEKWVIDRRLQLMEEEGIVFKLGKEAGVDVSAKKLLQDYDALVLCNGSISPRDIDIPGRNLKGIHFAMDYLTTHNRLIAGDMDDLPEPYNARGKHVIVIGGGDTGSDCVGTANRQFAQSIAQFQYRDCPPEHRSTYNPWPEWPMILTSSTSHEEGCERGWATLSKAFIGDELGHIKGLKVVDLAWNEDGTYTEITETERILPCDMALIAIGYQGTHREGLLEKLGVNLSGYNTVETQQFKTNVTGVFAAGDVNRGQSLVVWAIAEGRKAAEAVNQYLMPA